MHLDPSLASIVVAGIAAGASVYGARMSHASRNQLTRNGHTSKKPSVPDMFSDLNRKVDGLEAKVDRVSVRLDDHVEHSDQMDRRFEAVERQPRFRLF